jgi:dipeptidyl aminopeptidase/acylaminoacyl peptidase
MGNGKMSDVPQLFVCDADGGNVCKLTMGEDPVKEFLFSPSGDKVLIVRDVKLDEDIHDKYPDLPKAEARIETDLMYRHWNEWSDGAYSHVFVGTWNGKKIGELKDIMEGEKYHSPLRPFGGIEQIAWSRDGKKIAYTCKKLTGRESAVSTNSDIYIYDTESGETTNVSAPNKGYDTNPTFSADGTKLYWLSMERDGYESDRNRIYSKSLADGSIVDYTAGSELYVQQYALSADEKTIWFVANQKGCDQVFKIDAETKAISQVTKDTADYSNIAVAGEGLVATRTTMFSPADVYRIDVETGKAENITKANERTLSALDMGHVEERWIGTTDGKQMQTWVVYPADFDSSKKYPVLLYCQGGPQNTVSQFWSKRWNFALMAANGYIVVAPNRRGLPGFGVEWNEQISGDYGGQNMKDYLAAIDNVSKEAYADESKMGCVGASYGGYSTYWLAGNHQGRFKTFIAHCGIFNLEGFYPTTEEFFFANWEFGGAYWETGNEVAQRTYRLSPHKFVGNWDSPIMVIHGEKDFRIPYTQGMAAFNTARLRGLQAEFLYFPEECHWVSKPQNSILWHREFFGWLDRWLK